MGYNSKLIWVYFTDPHIIKHNSTVTKYGIKNQSK